MRCVVFKGISSTISKLNSLQIYFGAPIIPICIEIYRAKLNSPNTLRACFIEGKRFTPQEALSLGIVDEIAEGGSAGVFLKSQEVAKRLEGLAVTGVWGIMKVSAILELFSFRLDAIPIFLPAEGFIFSRV